jgi:cell division cycle 2-like protein
MTSRWATTAEDAAEDARRKAAKEEKKRLKAARLQAEAEAAHRAAAAASQRDHEAYDTFDGDRPSKRRRLSTSSSQHRENSDDQRETHLLRFPSQTWQPCRSIERFESLNHIEEGSYGYVSRAREEATGEIVAIKKLKLDTSRDGGFAVTALREIQCLQAARGHRHIVELREVVTSSYSSGNGGSGGNVYLVMSFIEHDLKTLQEEMETPFSPSEIKTLMLQLGSAVEFLHDHWILHRDLKTSNILMNNRGEIKLADFGMARFCGDPPPKNLTQLVVTLWYRAPELLLGTTSYGKEVDCWSLGCIFGELLLGGKSALIQGRNEVEQLSKVSFCAFFSQWPWRAFSREGWLLHDINCWCPCIDLRTLRHSHGDFLAGLQAFAECAIAQIASQPTSHQIG